MKEEHKEKLRQFYRENRRMPSYAEMLPLLGFKSKNAAFKLARKLEKEGFLGRDTRGKLLPGHLHGEVRLLGQVEAGFPSPAEEELGDSMSLDDWLIRNKEATYMLRVSGDSMKEAGILPGDMVLVDRSETATTGDIVIAEVDGKWTIKYLRRRGGRVYLEPANPHYPAIYPEEELKIAAVVKAVIRRY